VQRVALALFARCPCFALNPSATCTYNPALVWFHGCTIRWQVRSVSGELGATLTVLFSAESTSPRTTARPAAILPLLVILFIVSYGILTMLVFEQGQTIESQRTLIREMLKDSTQLATLKGKIARDDSKRIHDKATADHVDADSGSSAAGAKGSKKAGKSARTLKQVPGRPAADLEDVRRITRVI